VKTNVELFLNDFGIKPSEIGLKSAKIISLVFNGLHNAPFSNVEAIDWERKNHTVMNIYHSLSTFDLSKLTELVVLSHDFCVRLEISAVRNGILELMFHPRIRGDGPGQRSKVMPTIEQQIKRIRNKRYKVFGEKEISGDHCFEVSQHKARKKYICYLCEKPISKGEVHVINHSVHVGYWFNTRMHTKCFSYTSKWDGFDWELHDSHFFRQEYLGED
jgi:hypothetical protein